VAGLGGEQVRVEEQGPVDQGQRVAVVTQKRGGEGCVRMRPDMLLADPDGLDERFIGRPVNLAPLLPWRGLLFDECDLADLIVARRVFLLLAAGQLELLDRLVELSLRPQHPSFLVVAIGRPLVGRDAAVGKL